MNWLIVSQRGESTALALAAALRAVEGHQVADTSLQLVAGQGLLELTRGFDRIVAVGAGTVARLPAEVHPRTIAVDMGSDRLLDMPAEHAVNGVYPPPPDPSVLAPADHPHLQGLARDAAQRLIESVS